MDSRSHTNFTPFLIEACNDFIDAASIDEIASALCTASNSLVAADYCGLARVTDSGLSMVYEHYFDGTPPTPGVDSFPTALAGTITANQLEHVYRSGCAEYLPDLTATRSIADTGSERGAFHRSAMIVPIENWGLGVWTHCETDAFTMEQKDLLVSLCSLAATAFERERSHRQRNERLDSFTRVIAHDLRNPLNVATGYLKLLDEECSSEYLSSLEDALDRMAHLIDDFLVLSLEGEMINDIQFLSLAECIERSWKHVETYDADLRVETDISVEADRNRLEQVFENLFRNAIEHGGREVTVTVGDLPTGFYIEDDGSGIPDDLHQSVFRTGVSTKSGGTGLGLSIIQEIVVAHGWNIELRSGTTGGARFEITGVTCKRDP